jgi:hypothetical protein
MLANTIQWLAVTIFFLVFWGFTFGEAAWLKKRGWAEFTRALSFTVTSNLLGFFIGWAVVFVILLILLMLTFEPVKNATANEFIMWSGVVLALIFPPIFLMLVKRLLLKLFKMDTGRRVWGFSALSSVLIVFSSVVVPSAFLYIILKFVH